MNTRSQKILASVGIIALVVLALVALSTTSSKDSAISNEATTNTQDSAQAVRLYTTPISTAVSNGQQFTVDVRLDSLENYVNAVRAVITYDPLALDFVSSSADASVFEVEAENDQNKTTGSITITRGAVEPVNGNNSFITLTFSSKADSGTTTIAIDKAESTAVDVEQQVDVLQTTGNTVVTLRP